MVICRYFLQGNCRFGGNCRFEHSAPNYNSNINLVHQQQLQSYRQQQQQHGQCSSNDFFELVQNELEMRERSGQWLLSSSCPHPSKSAALPGLSDHSPEERCYLMDDAQSTGNVESCERVRSGPASPSSNPFQTNTTAGSIFGGASVKASPVKPNTFGGSQTPQASVFGGASVVSAPANPFGGAATPQPSMFGGGSAAMNVNPFLGQSSIFGGGAAPAPAPAPTSSIFGGAYNGQPSIFGGQQSAYSVGTANVFGGGSSTMNSFSFAAAAQDQRLIPPTPAPSIPIPTMGSIFGGGDRPPVQAVAIAPNAAQVVAPTVNPFGAPTQQMKPVSQPVDLGAHTSLNDLTEEEKAEFTAPTFSRGRIPLRPPPTQLCA